MMWRLADSVFFYMQETRRVWHGIDASQFYWLLCTAAVEPDEVIDNRVLNLARYLDDTGVRYTRVAVRVTSPLLLLQRVCSRTTSRVFAFADQRPERSYSRQN